MVHDVDVGAASAEFGVDHNETDCPIGCIGHDSEQ